MRQPIKLILFSIAFLTAIIVHSQDQCKVVGWATQNGGVTGGGTATPTVVTTYAALKTALTTASVKVVHISGTITFPTNGRITIQDTDGKTIIGLAGSRVKSVDLTSSGSGIFYIKRSTNFIMRNITFEGPAAYDEDGNDNLTLDDCQNFWVDHCDFQDGMDGNFDIKNMSDYISITWCKFSYNKPPKSGGSGGSNDHRYTNLIGSSDGATQDAGKLRITFQYCWWAQGCVERMPRVRFGKLHIANCFYNSTVSSSCIRAGYKADLYIESNVFVGVKKPIDLYNNDFTAVTEKNNIFTNTTGGTTGSGTSFTPPYSLTIAAANTVQSLVSNTSCGAGATLDSPTQCGCGTPTNPSPTATISAPSTVCVNAAITITATANANGGTLSKVDFYNGATLIGSDNSSPYSISYTPIASGTLTLKATATNTSGTTGSSSTTSVSVSAAPTATASSSTTNLCTTGSIVLTASSGASYIWFNGTTQVGTNATYTANAPGAYTVEVTNASNCKATSAARTLTGTPQATPTISSSTTNLCTTGSIVLTASSGTSYVWFNGTNQVGTNATYTANAPGTYTVEVTNASNCKATSAARTLTGTPQAIPTISSSTTNLCTTGSIVLTASSGASYVWFNGTNQVGTNATYTANAPGAYTVEVTNTSNCKATSAARTLTGTPQATPTISSSTTNLCTTGSIVLTASSGASYVWFNGTNQVGTNATYTANAPGAYTVEVTNASNCKATSAARTLTGTPQATPTISSSTTNLCTTGSIVLTASSGASYVWFNGTTQVGTNETYTANAPGAYTVEVTNASNCKATSAARTLTGTPQATPTISSSTTSFCTGGSVILTSSAGSSYKWFNGTNQVGTSETYTANAPGAYTVEVTNASDCKATSAVKQIGVNALPTAAITSPSTSFCTGGSVVLTSSAGSSYKWFNGANQVGTNSTYTAATPGDYTVEVTNASDCKATSAILTITISTPTITAPVSSICDGSTVTLTASAGASYKWFNGTNQVGTNSTYNVTNSGAYKVEVTFAGDCKATSAVKQIGVNALPTAVITSPSTSFCTGKSTVLTSSAGSSYKWFNGTTQVGTDAIYTASTAGNYTVEVTNANDCKATSAITTITVSTIPAPIITSSSTAICAGGSVILSSSAGVSYKWFNGTAQVGTSSAYTALNAGAYTVQITDANGCKSSSPVTQIDIVSTFTWYADSDNDNVGDILNPLNSCTKPNGYVSTTGDECPTDPNKTTPGNCGCNQSETVSCITTTTINGSSSNIKVVPQPFDVNTSITIENLGNIQSITIINTSGAIVEMKQGIKTESIVIGESLASGLYTVLIQSDLGVYTTKIVKK